MCVNSSTMKCCGSCSLTDATIILGVLYALGAIGSATSRQWGNMALMAVACILFVLVCIKRNDVNVRKLLFIVVTIIQTISVVVLIGTFIYLVAVDDWVTDACTDGDYNTYDECKDAVYFFVYVAFGVALVIQLLLCWCEVQILYYGWKEQEMLAGQKTNPGMVETAQMPYQQVQGKGDQSVAQGQPVQQP